MLLHIKSRLTLLIYFEVDRLIIKQIFVTKLVDYELIFGDV